MRTKYSTVPNNNSLLWKIFTEFSEIQILIKEKCSVALGNKEDFQVQNIHSSRVHFNQHKYSPCIRPIRNERLLFHGLFQKKLRKPYFRQKVF